MAYVKRVVYPRISGTFDGWLSFEQDVRRHVEAVRLLADSYRVPNNLKNRQSVLYHGQWTSDGGWILHPQEAGFDTAWVPAFALQLESFRSRRLPLSKFNRVGASKGDFAATLVRAALDQALGGYRTPDRTRFSVLLHSWLDDLGALFTSIPAPTFTIASVAPAAQSLASYRVDRRKSKRPDDILFWDVNRRMAGAFTEDETIWAPAFKQQLDAFLLPPRTRDVRRIDEWTQSGWTGLTDRLETAAERPALDQLLGGFRLAARLGLSPAYLQWTDPGAWLSQFSLFDAALWPGIGDLLGSFRSEPGRHLDVRRQDTTFDAWLATEPLFSIPDFTAPHGGLANSYRMAGRRVTMDLFGGEWQHDMAWLRDVLGLPDPAPDTRRPHRRLLVMGVGR